MKAKVNSSVNQESLEGEDSQTRMVRRLYCTRAGRILLKILVRPWISRLAGSFLDTGLSRKLIKPFIRNNGIDMSLYEKREYPSFNAFFIREIKEEYRPVSHDHEDLIAPCDGRLSVFSIDGSTVEIKGLYYDMAELVRSRELAEKYEGGTLLIFRLTVSDYHRYHYPDSGIKSENTHIDGVLHTVHPVASHRRGIYCENAREYFTLYSDNFGDMLYIQVGALLVGRIHNRHQNAVVQRGHEAGWFEYGGSTVILCLQKQVAELLPEIRSSAEEDRELPVKMGQVIGRALYTDEK